MFATEKENSGSGGRGLTICGLTPEDVYPSIGGRRHAEPLTRGGHRPLRRAGEILPDVGDRVDSSEILKKTCTHDEHHDC